MDRFEPVYFFVLLAVLPLLVFVVHSNRRADRARRDHVGGPADPEVAPTPPPRGGAPRQPESFPLCDIHPYSYASPGNLKALAGALNVWLETEPPGTVVLGLQALGNGHWPMNPYAPVTLESVDGVLVFDESEHFPAKVFGATERAIEDLIANLTESLPGRLYARIVGPDPWHDEHCQR